MLEEGSLPYELVNELHYEGRDVVETFMDNIENPELHAVLSELEKKQLLLLILECEYGFNQREIASILGVSQKEVCRRRKAIHKKIREKINIF